VTQYTAKLFRPDGSVAASVPVEVAETAQIPPGYTKRTNPSGWITTSNFVTRSFYDGYKGGLFVDDGAHLWLRNFELLNSTNQYNAWRGVSGGSSYLTMDGGSIHDIKVTNTTVHSEGLWVSGDTDTLIKRVNFYRNAHFHLVFAAWPLNRTIRAVVEDCRFELNRMASPNNSFYNVQIRANTHQITFRRCVFTQAVDMAGVSITKNGTYGPNGTIKFEDCIWTSDPTAGIPGIS
jgi:hypothetical protein